MKGMRLVVLVAVVGVLLALAIPTFGSTIDEQETPAAAEEEDCGTFNIAVNNWVGYEADAFVVGQVAKERLGCLVNYVYIDEQISWQGFASGQVDVVLENWGHPELFELYVDQLGVAEDTGWIGIDGVIGWWVPPWMAEEHPDITDWRNLNKYADLFKTSESGGKGQLLDGDPGFVTNDEALVKNLNLDFEVVFAGSEAALIQAFRSGEQQKKPVLGYFYSPQWFLAEVPLVKVDLPKYTEGCDADPAKVDCDYPVYKLNKIVATRFAEDNGPAYRLVEKWQWTADDQNLVAKYITSDGMRPEDAAQKWIDDNPDKVDSWLEG
jgi:glycine betaine/proline transport system substrate-binding protein